jgi:hypothetical protein
MREYRTSTFVNWYSIFDILHPAYFAETFGQSNHTMFVAYLSVYGDKPRRYKTTLFLFYNGQLTTNNLSNEIHVNDSEAYFIGTDIEPHGSIISWHQQPDPAVLAPHQRSRRSFSRQSL